MPSDSSLSSNPLNPYNLKIVFPVEFLDNDIPSAIVLPLLKRLKMPEAMVICNLKLKTERTFPTY